MTDEERSSEIMRDGDDAFEDLEVRESEAGAVQGGKKPKGGNDPKGATMGGGGTSGGLGG